MQNPSRQSRPVRFGAFELDLSTGGLRKDGLKVKLQDQPMQILELLLERPGQVVSRDELCKRLWPSDIFVDFDHSLNKAINKLRDALQDSAEHPSFIETIPKRGYRFIAEIAPAGPAANEAAARSAPVGRKRARLLAALLLLGFLVGVSLFVRRGSSSGLPPRSKSVSIAALEAYTQGHFHAEQAAGLAYHNGKGPVEERELDTARAFFHKAILQDPTYAQAYVGLARTWAERPVSEDGPAKAEELLRKAIQLEPELAEAHQALATLDVLRLWRWQEADEEYRRAIELNPNSAEAHARYAEYLDCMKRFAEGMNEFLRTQQLDPGHSFQPNPFYRRRQYGRAIEVDQGEIQRRAFGFWSYQDLAFDYDGAGKRVEAARTWEEMLRQLEFTEIADAMHRGMQESGPRGSIAALAAALEEADRRGPPPPSFFVAIMQGQLGEKDRAFYWLERGYNERSAAYSALNVDPCWDPLRDDPRFKDLVRRVGLPNEELR